jgi:hypothetical protein
LPGLPDKTRGGSCRTGGVIGYPLDRLNEEVAYLAYHFHWSLQDILDLEHGDRQQWVDQVAGFNRRLSQAAISPDASQ